MEEVLCVSVRVLVSHPFFVEFPVVFEGRGDRFLRCDAALFLPSLVTSKAVFSPTVPVAKECR